MTYDTALRIEQNLGAAVHHKRDTCRVCGSDRLRSFLALGEMPLANAFLRSPHEFAREPRFPLDVYFCESCSLVQLVDVIDPRVLFRNYIYLTGTADTIATHNAAYARTIADLQRLTSEDLVVEIASNDGSLLRCFRQLGARTLGIEPAVNIAARARAAGIDTLAEFFGRTCAARVRAEYGPAQAVVANNVLAHVDDTAGFLAACRELLDESGLVVVEVTYLRDLVSRLEYDTIYHEHLCYFSATTLIRSFEAAGLSIVRVDEVPIHGGSLRVYAGPRERYQRHAPAILALALDEQAGGLTTLARYRRLASDVARTGRALVELLEALNCRGQSVAGYGAPAKGNTLLNYCAIDTRLLPYTVDRSPMKIGLYTPGTHIPVLPVSTLLDRQPDYVLILAWNFAEEIMAQQDAYRRRGGRFIVPLPEPSVI